MKLEARIAIEKRIVKHLVKELLDLKFMVSIYDGEEVAIKRSTDLNAIMAETMACDVEWIEVWRLRLDTDKPLSDALHPKSALRKFTHVGNIMLVYGNDGYDVINDYHTSLEQCMPKTLALVDELATKHG